VRFDEDRTSSPNGEKRMRRSMKNPAGSQTGLPDHFPLIADAALAFVGESLDAGENRIGIEMRFRDHFQFEAAASPGIVEVGRERILIRQRAQVAQRPHPSRARRYHH
jgi:hypothetical protein